MYDIRRTFQNLSCLMLTSSNWRRRRSCIETEIICYHLSRGIPETSSAYWTKSLKVNDHPVDETFHLCGMTDGVVSDGTFFKLVYILM